MQVLFDEGKSQERNLIEAASAGASTSIKLVANIAANLIAFLALLQFINETLKWFGAQVGLKPPHYPDFTFQVCYGKVSRAVSSLSSHYILLTNSDC